MSETHREAFEEARENLLESLAEIDDDLCEKYLGGDAIEVEVRTRKIDALVAAQPAAGRLRAGNAYHDLFA